MDEFQIIEKVKGTYNVTRIKRKENILWIAINLPDHLLNVSFEYKQNVEQYYKSGNSGFYYVILKFELI